MTPVFTYLTFSLARYSGNILNSWKIQEQPVQLKQFKEYVLRLGTYLTIKSISWCYIYVHTFLSIFNFLYPPQYQIVWLLFALQKQFYDLGEIINLLLYPSLPFQCWRCSKDLQLVQRQHLLPHDHRQPRPRLQASLRDQPRLQDGRPSNLLHQPHAHQHEQAEDHQGQIKGFLCYKQKNILVYIYVYAYIYPLEHINLSPIIMVKMVKNYYH